MQAPSCPLGYTDADLLKLLGDRLDKFSHWMRSQTVAVCEGRRYNHDAREYEPDECAGHPHGVVTYPSDVERFLLGLPIID